MKHLVRNILAAAALALMLAPPAFAQQASGSNGLHSPAKRPGASSGSIASSPATASDPALQSFKNMSPEERGALVAQALETYKNMSPEERRQLTEQAKAMGGDMDAYGAEWEKLLSPGQQKMVSDQMKGYVREAPAKTGKAASKPATAQDNMTYLRQQLRSLTPAQRQALVNSLKQPGMARAPGTPAADPCAEYKSVNPPSYANCKSRMRPGAGK